MKRAWVLLTLIAPMLVWAASSPDETFYKRAAEGGIFEVDAGKLAQDKGNSQQVKDFGAMMVKDHSAANEKLKEIDSGQDADAKAFASATLPTVRKHLKAIDAIAADAGVSTK
jgi:putative membrane protein